MHIFHFNIALGKIIGKVLRHFPRERCNENTLVFFGALVYFRNKVVNLTLCRANRNFGVKKPRGSYNLLDGLRASRPLKLTGRGAYKYALMRFFVKLVKCERSVVISRRKPETEVYKALFARAVAAVHSPDLRQGDVRLVNKQKKIVGKIVKKRKRRFAGLSAGHNARIVLYPLAKARFPEHFYIVLRALHNALGFKQFALAFKFIDGHKHFVIYLVKRAFHFFRLHNIVRSGINRNVRKVAFYFARQGVYF